MNQWLKNVILLAIIFSLSFLTVSYYLRKNRARAEAAKSLEGNSELTISSAINNAPLPQCELVNKKGAGLSEQDLRRGKVMLVLVSVTCNFCIQEGEFLRTRMAEHKDIRFYGVVSFGTESDLLTAEHRFPFEL